MKAKAKSLLYYREEWEIAFKNAVESRARAGKRTPPKTPPLYLLIKFVLPDGTVRGNRAAPAVVDLRRAELRIPSYEIRIPLKPLLVRALIEENSIEPRPEFVLQVTRKGFLRIIASRAFPLPPLQFPLRIIVIDENSSHGFPVAAWDVSDDRAVLSYFEKHRPVNHGYGRRLAAQLQSFADKPSERLREELRELLSIELTPERARELAARLRAKERRANDEFAARVVAAVRKLVRDAAGRGMRALILVEPVDAESLRWTELQGTLLRTRKRLANLARYEGAHFARVRASGKLCPRCGERGVEVIRTRHSRIYQCLRCSAQWDRDKGVHYNMVKRFFERMLSEECDDENALVTRVIIALEEWLERHPNILTY